MVTSKLRPPPTTVEAIQGIALRQPARPAIEEAAERVSYGELLCAITSCAAWLRQRGVRPGQRVAVSGPGLARQLIALLACESVGAATLSCDAEADPDAAALCGQVDWVLSGRGQAGPAGVGWLSLEEAFQHARLQALPLAQADPGLAIERTAPLRIVRSADPAGGSRCMVLLRQAQEFWIERSGDIAGYSPQARLLLAGSLVSNGTYARACACMRLGAALVAGYGSNLAALAPTHVWGSPAALERLLAALPEGAAAPGPVAVASAGGPLAPALRARLAAVFRGAVVSQYVCNAAGWVCDQLDAEGIGLLSPGVDLRILGPQGECLPPGAIGWIAVRTPCMAEGTLGQPEASAQAFRDGWFISTDIGRLLGLRRLQWLGRADGRVDLGAGRQAAAPLENTLRSLPAVRDAALLTVHREAGAVTLGLVLVLAPGAAQEQAMAQVQAALRLPSGVAAQVLAVDALPRRPDGAPDPLALLRLFVEAT